MLSLSSTDDAPFRNSAINLFNALFCNHLSILPIQNIGDFASLWQGESSDGAIKSILVKKYGKSSLTETELHVDFDLRDVIDLPVLFFRLQKLCYVHFSEYACTSFLKQFSDPIPFIAEQLQPIEPKILFNLYGTVSCIKSSVWRSDNPRVRHDSLRVLEHSIERLRKCHFYGKDKVLEAIETKKLQTIAFQQEKIDKSPFCLELKLEDVTTEVVSLLKRVPTPKEEKRGVYIPFWSALYEAELINITQIPVPALIDAKPENIREHGLKLESLCKDGVCRYLTSFFHSGFLWVFSQPFDLTLTGLVSQKLPLEKSIASSLLSHIFYSLSFAASKGVLLNTITTDSFLVNYATTSQSVISLKPDYTKFIKENDILLELQNLIVLLVTGIDTTSKGIASKEVEELLSAKSAQWISPLLKGLLEKQPLPK